MPTIKFNARNSEVVAHRGLSGIETENTAAAFIAAANRNYVGMETDVRVTLDGKYVCFHDRSTQRIACDNLVIEECSFDTLRALQLCDKNGKKGRADLRIITLLEYIDICQRYNKVPVIELKDEMAREHIEGICNEIATTGYLEKVIFMSFVKSNLDIIRQLHPEQTIQYITGEYNDELVEMLCREKYDLDIEYKALTEERVKLLQSKGIKVNAWTCDDPAVGEMVASWGVDYIETNILEKL